MTTRQSPQLHLRLPEDLREKLVDAAEKSHRSINAELVARLEASFATPSAPSEASPASRADLFKQMQDVLKRLDNVENVAEKWTVSLGARKKQGRE